MRWDAKSTFPKGISPLGNVDANTPKDLKDITALKNLKKHEKPQKPEKPQQPQKPENFIF